MGKFVFQVLKNISDLIRWTCRHRTATANSLRRQQLLDKRKLRPQIMTRLSRRRLLRRPKLAECQRRSLLRRHSLHATVEGSYHCCPHHRHRMMKRQQLRGLWTLSPATPPRALTDRHRQTRLHQLNRHPPIASLRHHSTPPFLFEMPSGQAATQMRKLICC